MLLKRWMVGKFHTTGDFYEDFHLQTGKIPQPATSTVCKMPFFVGRIGFVGLVGCALEFMGRIGLELVFGCMSPADMIFKYVCTEHINVYR